MAIGPGDFRYVDARCQFTDVDDPSAEIVRTCNCPTIHVEDPRAQNSGEVPDKQLVACGVRINEPVIRTLKLYGPDTAVSKRAVIVDHPQTVQVFVTRCQAGIDEMITG
jgi:hypothetical protein